MCNTTPCDVIDVTVEPDEFEVFEVAEISWVVFSLLKFDRRYETEALRGQKRYFDFVEYRYKYESKPRNECLNYVMHESKPKIMRKVLLSESPLLTLDLCFVGVRFYQWTEDSNLGQLDGKRQCYLSAMSLPMKFKTSSLHLTQCQNNFLSCPASKG